jgi:FO synthase
MEAPMWRRGRPRSGPTFGETLIVHAVARLVLHPWITNMNESISRRRVAATARRWGPEQMEELIRSAGRTPRQRTTLYGTPPPEQVRRSFGAAPLSDLVNPPAPKGRRGDRRPLVRAVLGAR